MENLESQILEFGRKREFSLLEKLLASTDNNELSNLLTRRLNSPNFCVMWNYILQSFNDQQTCQDKRLSWIKTVLDELKRREVFSLQTCTTIVQRICIELMKFKTEHLVELCRYCLNILQSNTASTNTSGIWRELLPDCLRVVSERDTVPFNDLEYTGQEFQTDYLNTICMSNWSPNIVTSLTAMFIDMTLTKEEHQKIVNKLACFIEKLTPQEIPPLIYQLLKLCRHHNSPIIFLKLQNYFNVRIYNNTEFLSFNSSESHNLDCIGNAEDHDALEAESIVLYHIQNAASIGHNCIKDFLKFLKNCLKCPKYILQPFQLLALFAISTVQHYEETVFDIIRHSIVKCYNEQQRSAASFWHRDLCNTTCSPNTLFIQIINVGDREFLLETLVNFGFALLNVGAALGRDIIAEKQWSLGTLILIRIIQKKRHVVKTILKTFCNHIVTKQSANQYIECLYILSKNSPLLMLENQHCIIELMESLVQLSGSTGNQLLDVLVPLTKVSPTIRDQFILILRKGLYMRSVENRQVAVNGFLKLLEVLKLSNMDILSETSGSFSSGYSLYTQMSLSRSSQTIPASHFSNEALCWEMLGILKRCFVQQAEVKAVLYDNIHKAVKENRDLGIPVLDTVWFHFMEYYVIDKEICLPLDFTKAAVLRETDSISLEPLGKLIFTISQIVSSLCQSEDDKDNSTVVKYLDILESLCTRMTNCELVHLELDDGTDLTDILPESQQKMHILKEVLLVYEALIGYKIISWSKECLDQGRCINGLFQGYSRFYHFGKNLLKPKKSKKNDKMSQGDTNKQSQKNKSTEIEPHSSNIFKKPDDNTRNKFKVPDTILNIEIVDKALKLLLEPSVPWADTAEVNTLKTKPNMHRHFIQAALAVLTKLKSYKTFNAQYKKRMFEYLSSVASTFYNRVVLRFNDYVDFDCISAVSSIECFNTILQLIYNQYREHVITFLCIVGEKEKEDDLVEHLTPLINQFQKMLEMDEEDLSTDAEMKKLSPILVSCITILCNFLPSNSNSLSLQLYEWLKDYVTNKTLSSRVSGSFMALLFDIHLKYKAGLNILEKISEGLKNSVGLAINESFEEPDEVIKCIDLSTANSIILCVCSNIKVVLDDVENVISRTKSELYILAYSRVSSNEGRKEELKSKEKGISCHLCFLTNILTNLVTLALVPGNITEAIFKALIQFYSTISSFTKYFLGRSSKTNVAFQGVWFEKLIKLTGKQLTPQVYLFISQIGEAGQPKENMSQGNRKRDECTTIKNKVLRQTKLIPKLIFEIEQLSKFLIQLTKKTKVDLSRYVGTGVVRDFRILHLEEVIEQEGLGQQPTQNSIEEENSDQGENDVSIDENGSPPSKKRKSS